MSAIKNIKNKFMDNKKTIILLTSLVVVVFIAVFFALSSGKESGGGDYNGVVDFNPQECDFNSEDLDQEVEDVECGEDLNYKDQTYKTVKIGNQCWFAEDLSYDPGCLVDDPKVDSWDGCSCVFQDENYGGIFYQWGAAMLGSDEEGSQGVCPDGWSIPTNEEWIELEKELGMTDYDEGGWRGADIEAGNMIKIDENNESGFSGAPAGSIKSTGEDFGFDSHNLWWSSTKEDGGHVTRRYISSSNVEIHRGSENPYRGYSVRCVRGDNE